MIKKALFISFVLVLMLSSTSKLKAQEVLLISPDSFLGLMKTNNSSTQTVYNFWATWCKPCVEELPYFMQLDTALGKDSVNLVFLSFDSPSNKASVEKFVQSKEIKGTHYLLNTADFNSFINAINPHWEGSIPYTISYKNKTLSYHDYSFANLSELLQFIKK